MVPGLGDTSSSLSDLSGNRWGHHPWDFRHARTHFKVFLGVAGGQNLSYCRHAMTHSFATSNCLAEPEHRQKRVLKTEPAKSVNDNAGNPDVRKLCRENRHESACRLEPQSLHLLKPYNFQPSRPHFSKAQAIEDKTCDSTERSDRRDSKGLVEQKICRLQIQSECCHGSCRQQQPDGIINAKQVKALAVARRSHNFAVSCAEDAELPGPHLPSAGIISDSHGFENPRVPVVVQYGLHDCDLSCALDKTGLSPLAGTHVKKVALQGVL